MIWLNFLISLIPLQMIKEYTDEQVLGLVGRKQVVREPEEFKGFYKNKVVLVTGGAGSIGSQVVRSLLGLGVKRVVVFDWWENGVFYLQNEIDSPLVEYVIGDVKTKKICRTMKKYKPDVVIHASAYKHVPLMQSNPLEAFNNNVWGGLNVMQCAVKYDVKNFVLVSTDKAVNPTNVMGATKRILELLMLEMEGDTKFNAVRFGNVIQSNGSVVPTFLKQLKEGKDLTVTHRNITRYFMTKREASELILMSAMMCEDREIFLLDMGQPVKIHDLAKALIEDNKSKSKIKISGLRRGEKLYEELSYNPTTMDRTSNRKIFTVRRNCPPRNLTRFVREELKKSLEYEIEDAGLVSLLVKLGFNVRK